MNKFDPLRRARITWIWAAGAIALHAGPVIAENGWIQLRAPFARTGSGVTMVVDTMWVDGPGYRPIRVELRRQKPAALKPSRRFRLEVTCSSDRSDQTSVQYIHLPEGKMKAETTIAVPQSGSLRQVCTVQIFENGQLLRDLCQTRWRRILDTPGWTRNMVNGSNPSLLFIDTDAPSRNKRELRATMRSTDQGSLGVNGPLPDIAGYSLMNDVPRQILDKVRDNSSRKLSNDELLRFFEGSTNVALRAPHDLPTRWIDYDCVDITLISLADVGVMHDQAPAQWRAIRRWLATGTTLCVHGTQGAFQQLDEYLDGMEATDTDIDIDTGTVKNASGWRISLIADEPSSDPLNAFSGETVRREGPPTDFPPRLEIAERPFGMGRVVALTVDFPHSLAPRNLEMLSIRNTLDDYLTKDRRLTWLRRHGIGRGQIAMDFDRFLIPDVGLAPVGVFRLLITLFVLVIGPVNYLVLRRCRRLHLLLLTVPLGAAIVTVSLVGYALLADGLGVRCRVRSYTRIDQRRAEAVCWSRQTYYAGLLPSSGLVFPSDTTVYAIAERARPHDRKKVERTRNWFSDRQQLAQGYLRSRVASQFLTVRAARCEQRLDIEPGPRHQSAQIQNLLTTRVHQLMLIDARGNTFWMEDLAAGARGVAYPEPLGRSLLRLRRTVHEHRSLPKLPQGDLALVAKSFQHSNILGNIEENLLEQRIQAATRGSANQPRTYVAIVDHSPAVPLGIKTAQQQASLHLIEGRW